MGQWRLQLMCFTAAATLAELVMSSCPPTNYRIKSEEDDEVGRMVMEKNSHIECFDVSSDGDLRAPTGYYNGDDLSSCTWIEADDRGIVSVNESFIAALGSSLTYLSLQYNQLSSLPENFGMLSELRELTMGHNEFTSWPIELYNLSRLTWFDFEHQVPPVAIPADALTAWPDLRNFLFSYNDAPELPSEIGLLTQLKYLRLRSNRFSELPTELYEMTALTHLNINANLLNSIPSELGLLTNLRKLQIGDAVDPLIHTSLPSELGRLTKLTDFNAIHLNLGDDNNFPPEYANWNQTLGLLHIDGNSFSQLPTGVEHFTHLEVFSAFSNSFQEIPSRLLDFPLTYGNFHLNDITEIPPELPTKLTNLRKLDFLFNNISTIPTEIGFLSCLTYLDLYWNPALHVLPSELGKLTSLETLRLGFTKVSALPQEVSDNCVNLKELNIDNAMLTHFPDISKWNNLEKLYLFNNPGLNNTALDAIHFHSKGANPEINFECILNFGAWYVGEESTMQFRCNDDPKYIDALCGLDCTEFDCNPITTELMSVDGYISSHPHPAGLSAYQNYPVANEIVLFEPQTKPSGLGIISCGPGYGTNGLEPPHATCRQDGLEFEFKGCLLCPPGYFSDTTSAEAPCDACALGFFNDGTGQTACHACSPGYFANELGSSECTAATPGYHVPVSGQASQTACVPGQLTTANASTRCSSCPAGKASASAAADNCTQCAEGSYSDSAGSLTCKGCLEGWFAPEQGRSFCDRCSDTYSRAYTTNGAASSSCDACVAGFYRSKSGQCVECVIESTECPEEDGLKITAIRLKPGFWRTSPETDNPYIKQCPNSAACLGGPTMGTSGDACAEGYTGPLCAVCEDGYYVVDYTSECLPCNRIARQLYAALAVIVLFLCGLTAVIVQQRRIMRSVSTHVQSVWQFETQAAIVPKLKIIIPVFQVLSSLEWVYESTDLFEWGGVDKFFKTINAHLGFDISMAVPFGCFADYNALSSLIATTIPPLATLAVLVLLEAFLFAIQKRDRMVNVRRLAYNGLLFWFLVALPTSSTKIFRSLRSCDDVSESESFMYDDYGTSCDSDRFATTRSVAYVLLSIYVVIAPLAILSALIIYRNSVKAYQSGSHLLLKMSRQIVRSRRVLAEQGGGDGLRWRRRIAMRTSSLVEEVFDWSVANGWWFTSDVDELQSSTICVSPAGMPPYRTREVIELQLATLKLSQSWLSNALRLLIRGGTNENETGEETAGHPSARRSSRSVKSSTRVSQRSGSVSGSLFLNFVVGEIASSMFRSSKASASMRGLQGTMTNEGNAEPMKADELDSSSIYSYYAHGSTWAMAKKATVMTAERLWMSSWEPFQGKMGTEWHKMAMEGFHETYAYYRVWWWEVYEIYRKMALCGFAVVMFATPEERLVFAIAVETFSFYLLGGLRPYQSWFDNALAQASRAITLAILLYALSVRTFLGETNARKELGPVMIAVLLITIITTLIGSRLLDAATLLFGLSSRMPRWLLARQTSEVITIINKKLEPPWLRDALGEQRNEWMKVQLSGKASDRFISVVDTDNDSTTIRGSFRAAKKSISSATGFGSRGIGRLLPRSSSVTPTSQPPPSISSPPHVNFAGLNGIADLSPVQGATQGNHETPAAFLVDVTSGEEDGDNANERARNADKVISNWIVHSVGSTCNGLDTVRSNLVAFLAAHSSALAQQPLVNLADAQVHLRAEIAQACEASRRDKSLILHASTMVAAASAATFATTSVSNGSVAVDRAEASMDSGGGEADDAARRVEAHAACLVAEAVQDAFLTRVYEAIRAAVDRNIDAVSAIPVRTYGQLMGMSADIHAGPTYGWGLAPASRGELSPAAPAPANVRATVCVTDPLDASSIVSQLQHSFSDGGTMSAVVVDPPAGDSGSGVEVGGQELPGAFQDGGHREPCELPVYELRVTYKPALGEIETDLRSKPHDNSAYGRDATIGELMEASSGKLALKMHLAEEKDAWRHGETRARWVSDTAKAVASLEAKGRDKVSIDCEIRLVSPYVVKLLDCTRDARVLLASLAAPNGPEAIYRYYGAQRIALPDRATEGGDDRGDDRTNDDSKKHKTEVIETPMDEYRRVRKMMKAMPGKDAMSEEQRLQYRQLKKKALDLRSALQGDDIDEKLSERAPS